MFAKPGVLASFGSLLHAHIRGAEFTHPRRNARHPHTTAGTEPRAPSQRNRNRILVLSSPAINRHRLRSLTGEPGSTWIGPSRDSSLLEELYSCGARLRAKFARREDHLRPATVSVGWRSRCCRWRLLAGEPAFTTSPRPAWPVGSAGHRCNADCGHDEKRVAGLTVTPVARKLAAVSI